MTREVLLDIINRQFQSLMDVTDLSERAAGLGISGALWLIIISRTRKF